MRDGCHRLIPINGDHFVLLFHMCPLDVTWFWNDQTVAIRAFRRNCSLPRDLAIENCHYGRSVPAQYSESIVHAPRNVLWVTP